MSSPKSEPSRSAGPLTAPADFSLVLGGPLFQLLVRAHLSDTGLHLLRRRIVVLTLVAWLPLLVLSALEGQAWGGTVAVPFLLDIEVHARFLLALPLLVLSELVVHERMRVLVKQFVDRQLIPAESRSRFDAALAGATRLRNSVVAEVILIVLVYVVGVHFWQRFLVLSTSTWYAVPSDTGTHLTLTGWWYGYVSLPLFQFLLIRWYW